ncbi:MAG: PD-(D/E)XK nuclease family protein [Ruminococcus sp.]|nr:PD-(D/E)XK nuclease family protein [Ruminococcus sp.]
MKEVILLAPSVTEVELLRTMARYDQGTLCLRIVGESGLAERALMKSGIIPKEDALSSDEAAGIMLEIMKEIPYYSQQTAEGTSLPRTVVFEDAAALCRTLGDLRRQITDDEAESMRSLLTGEGLEFPEADAALLEAYEKYTARLAELGKADDVGFLRLAVDSCSPVTADILTLKEYPASPLALELCKRLSEGRCRETTMRELFGLTEKPLSFTALTRSYGSLNEARDVLDRIVKGGYKYDSCLVACADTADTPLKFMELSQEYGIPMTFGCGMPFGCTTSGGLLKAFEEWCTSGHYGIDALSGLIFSDCFDTARLKKALGCSGSVLYEAVKTAGNLKLSLDSQENARRIGAYRAALDPSGTKKLPFDPKDEDWKELGRNDRAITALDLAAALFKEFDKGMGHIVSAYAYKRPGCAELDAAGASAASEALALCDTADKCLELMPYIFGKAVYAQCSSGGALHITTIDKAAVSLREQLFITGLTSDYPSRTKENYLLCDEDMRLFGEQAPVSSMKAERQRESFEALIQLASDAGCCIFLSFNGYDTANLTECNASALMFDAFRRSKGGSASAEDFEKSLEKGGYFTSGYSALDALGKISSEGAQLSLEMPRIPPKAGTITVEGRKFSPTGIEKYLTCPRRFYLMSVLGLYKKEKNDPLKVVKPNELGTVFHDDVMEEHHPADYDIKDDFVADAEKVWDRFLLSRPPLDKNEADKFREQFLEMAGNVYELSRNYEVIAAEENLKIKLPSGIVLRGRYDSLEKHKPDGTDTMKNQPSVLVDFKTGRNIFDGTFEGSLQIMLYAYMLQHRKELSVEEKDREKENITVGMGEYRLVKTKETVRSVYNSDREKEVELLLENIASAIVNNVFDMTKHKSTCKQTYCEYRSLCGRED